MALIKCRECGRDISTKAKACPNCGVQPKRQPSMALTLFVIFIGVMLVVIVSGGGESSSTAQPETPEQKAQKDAENARYAVAAATSKLLRATMRDPESLKYETLRVSDDASVVCAEYRARNGFGGMNREFMVVADGKTSQKPSAWNKHCTKNLYDMMWAAK